MLYLINTLQCDVPRTIYSSLCETLFLPPSHHITTNIVPNCLNENLKQNFVFIWK